jgi:predicted dehydrogenase
MLGSYETLSFAKNRFSAADRDKLFADYSHEWDYLQWILGQVRRVIAVSHQSGQLELTQCPNVVDGLIEMESGVSGTVHLDYVQLPGRRRLAIVGDGGTLDVNVDMSQLSFSRRGDGFTRQYSFAEHRDALMEKQHDHFLAVIRERVPPRVNILDGLRALEVADALALSTKTCGWESVQR